MSALERIAELPRALSTISTGSLALDVALGIGGLPRGHITEIYGPEGTGKSTLGLQLIAEAQLRGGVGVLIDAERSFDPVFAASLGVGTGDLLLVRPDDGEQALTIVETLLRSQAVDVIVVDSAAALVPRAELDGSVGSAQTCLHPLVLSHGLRRLVSVSLRCAAAVVVLNQVRSAGNGVDVSSGGYALPLYAAVRIELRREVDDSAAGSLRVAARVLRNRFGIPFRKAALEFPSRGSMSREADRLCLGIALNLIERRPEGFLYRGRRLGASFEEAEQTLHSSMVLGAALEADIRSADAVLQQPSAWQLESPRLIAGAD